MYDFNEAGGPTFCYYKLHKITTNISYNKCFNSNVKTVFKSTAF